MTKYTKDANQSAGNQKMVVFAPPILRLCKKVFIRFMYFGASSSFNIELLKIFKYRPSPPGKNPHLCSMVIFISMYNKMFLGISTNISLQEHVLEWPLRVYPCPPLSWFSSKKSEQQQHHCYRHQPMYEILLPLNFFACLF